LKILQELTAILLNENFDITIKNGVVLIIYRPILDLDNITVGNFKTMTLTDLYYKEVR